MWPNIVTDAPGIILRRPSFLDGCARGFVRSRGFCFAKLRVDEPPVRAEGVRRRQRRPRTKRILPEGVAQLLGETYRKLDRSEAEHGKESPLQDADERVGDRSAAISAN
jgi:hypothetical protein